MGFLGKHFLSVKSVDREDLDELFRLAKLVKPIATGDVCTDILRGAVLGSMFFEPSTRTRLSFDAAFMRLGGAVSHTQGEGITSIVKGESYFDTSRVTSGFYDIILIRHPDPAAIKEFCSATNIPVINGGSGPEEHPTQALLDVYTLQEELEKRGKPVDGSTIALTGDLKYGRTVHSLVYLMCLYKDIKYVLVHPEHFGLPQEVIKYASKFGHSFTEAGTLEEGLKVADVIYATRLQKERLEEQNLITSLRPNHQIKQNIVQAYAKDDVVIMHPLPRDSRSDAYDLSTDLNGDPRLVIFKQTDNGLLIRMALFSLILGVDHELEKSFRPVRWFRPKKIGTFDVG